MSFFRQFIDLGFIITEILFHDPEQRTNELQNCISGIAKALLSKLLFSILEMMIIT